MDELSLTAYDRIFLRICGIAADGVLEGGRYELDGDAIEATAEAISDVTGFSGEPH